MANMTCHTVFLTLIVSLILVSELRAASLTPVDIHKGDSKVEKVETVRDVDPARNPRSQEDLQRQMVALVQGAQANIQNILQNQQREQLVFQEQQLALADQPDLQNYILKQQGIHVQDQQNLLLQHQRILQQQQQILQMQQLHELVNQSQD